MSDDAIYIFMLLFSIGVGIVTRRIGNHSIRKWVSSIVGIGVIYCVSGHHIIHPILSFCLHAALIQFSPKSAVHWINFFVGFAYLVNIF
jgi:hypothetical protein